MKIAIAIAFILNAAVLSVIAYQQREHYAKQSQIQNEAAEYASKHIEAIRKDVNELKLKSQQLTTLGKKIEKLSSNTSALQAGLKSLEPISGQAATMEKEIAQLTKDAALFQDKFNSLKNSLKADDSVEQLQKTAVDLQEKVKELNEDAISLRESIDDLNVVVFPPRENPEEAPIAAVQGSPKEAPGNIGLVLPPSILTATVTHQEAWKKLQDNRARLIQFAKECISMRLEVDSLHMDLKKIKSSSDVEKFKKRGEAYKEKGVRLFSNIEHPSLIANCGIKVGDFSFLYLGTYSLGGLTTTEDRRTLKKGKYRSIAVGYYGKKRPQAIRFLLEANDAFAEKVFEIRGKLNWRGPRTGWHIYDHPVPSNSGPTDNEPGYLQTAKLVLGLQGVIDTYISNAKVETVFAN